MTTQPRAVLLAVMLLGSCDDAQTTTVLAPTTLPATSPALAGGTVDRKQLEQLSGSDLVQIYANPEHFEPTTSFHVRRFGETELWEIPRHEMFREVRRHIVQRGRRMVPLLTTLVRAERTSDRPASSSRHSGLGNTYAQDATEVLALIGGRAAADVLLETLLDAKATKQWRRDAFSALERVTYLGYYQSGPHSNNYARCVPRPGAAKLAYAAPPELDSIATFYRGWLRGEGADERAWLKLALTRARSELAKDDLDAIYCAATFLQRDDSITGPTAVSKDDQPEKTAARIAEIIGKCRFVGVEERGGYKYARYVYGGDGRRVESIGEWTSLLAGCGGFARPYVGAMIRVEREANLGSDYYWAMRDIARVGGLEATQFLAEELPAIEQEVVRRGLTHPKYFGATLVGDDMPEDKVAQRWIFAARVARYGFDRYAGRAFASTDERLKWWSENHDRQPEAILRQHLPATLAEADSDTGFAFHLAYEIVPDLYRYGGRYWFEPVGMQGGRYPPATQPAPFRVKWLSENGDRLRYDPVGHCLRLSDG